MALLVGSVGLFLIIAGLMYLSQKVNIDKDNTEIISKEA
jgi:hypothetical protein